MKITDSDASFLKGEKFTSGLMFPLGGVGSLKSTTNRLGYLRELVKGKRIIHVGCVDHLPLIEEKRKSGNWLHEILTGSAEYCVGLDINKEGIEHLGKLGIRDLYCLDIIKDAIPGALKSQKFDYLVLGEMIEHVDNPVEFLAAVRTKFSGFVDALVTTTPNAFRFQNLVHTLRRREYINSDHRYWFSPYTLAKVLAQAGYENVEIDMVWDSPLRGAVSSTLKAVIGSAFPATRDCLIARSQFSNVRPN